MTMTAGIWGNEKEAASGFDALVRPSGLFTFYSEVPGVLVQPRAHQDVQGVRIDRILVPTERLTGWTSGNIGIEFKRPEVKIGRPVSQMLDYSRAAFRLLRGITVLLDWVFLWPAEKEHGDLASLFAQQRIGTARPAYGGVDFFCGEARILRVESDGTFKVGNVGIGKAVGSR